MQELRWDSSIRPARGYRGARNFRWRGLKARTGREERWRSRQVPPPILVPQSRTTAGYSLRMARRRTGRRWSGLGKFVGRNRDVELDLGVVGGGDVARARHAHGERDLYSFHRAVVAEISLRGDLTQWRVLQFDRGQ